MVGLYFAFAAASGWVVDDRCGTPPRKGPGPWWLTPLISAIVGAGVYYLVATQPGAIDAGGLVTPALAGGIGGGFAGSLLRGFAGGAQ